jgi:hypothetical protein
MNTTSLSLSARIMSILAAIVLFAILAVPMVNMAAQVAA